MHKLSSGLLRAHTLGYTLTRPALAEGERGRMRKEEWEGEREREREKERERENALQVHLACISRKGSDPLTRVKLPHSLSRGHCIPDNRKFIEFFRALCLSAHACFCDSSLDRADSTVPQQDAPSVACNEIVE